jgi:hypothetical protein
MSFVLVALVPDSAICVVAVSGFHLDCVGTANRLTQREKNPANVRRTSLDSAPTKCTTRGGGTLIEEQDGTRQIRA